MAAKVDMRTDAGAQSGFWSRIVPKLIDRTGEVFGRLKVVRRAGTSSSNKVLWECLCVCGNIVSVASGSLVTGNTNSCGCLLKEKITKHGGTGKSSYNTWRAMMRRCYVQTDKDYPKYGAVNISVCKTWHNYKTFAKDMGEPFGNQTLDRIDPNGNYEPSNCRWASPTVQNRNVRMSKRNKSGIRGVLKLGERWYAQITAKNTVFRSASFSSPEEAAFARKELEKMHWRAS